jgi:hypothetical protein
VFHQACSYLFDRPLLGAAKIKNRTTFDHHALKELIDNHQNL